MLSHDNVREENIQFHTMYNLYNLNVQMQLTWSAKCLLKTYGEIKFASEHAIGYLPLSHIGAMVNGNYSVSNLALIKILVAKMIF